MNGGTESIHFAPGVLAKSQIRYLFKKGAITSLQFGHRGPEIDGSAFDLPLGTTAWELTQGERPATRELARIQTRSSQAINLKVDSEQCFTFEVGKIYLVQLDTHLKLPPNINGRATGKSSVGRLDVITRLLTDEASEYDIVDAGYSGGLYLLVVPQTFAIKVRPGDSLNQLRLFCGSPYDSVITRPTIGQFGTPFWYVQRQEERRDYYDWNTIVEESQHSMTADPTLFDLTVELADPKHPEIYKADSQVSEAIDLKMKGVYNPTLYFKKVEIESHNGVKSVLLEQSGFYIMKSKERLCIPSDVAVEVIAISERIGDIRIHYAGFAHPCFGRHKHELRLGTPLIFEVRATDMHTLLYDGSLLARIQLYRMSTKTRPKPSNYEEQELNLSKVFYKWPEAPEPSES